MELKVVTWEQMTEEKTPERWSELVGSASQHDTGETQQRHKTSRERAPYEPLEGVSGPELALQEVWLLVDVVAGARSQLQILESLARGPAHIIITHVHMQLCT